MILGQILRKYIQDKEVIKLLEEVIGSFQSTSSDKGLPLGNLTSQLFANVYMNEFDQFVKHVLKQKYYIRYADDFVIMSQSRERLLSILPEINDFLKKNLKLSLHPEVIVSATFIYDLE
jgi:retron-type reverse transcriptase